MVFLDHTYIDLPHAPVFRPATRLGPLAFHVSVEQGQPIKCAQVRGVRGKLKPRLKVSEMASNFLKRSEDDPDPLGGNPNQRMK